MPIFEYLCSSCGKQFEAIVYGGKTPECPGCNAYLEQVRLTIRLTGRLTEDSLPDRGRDELVAAFRAWRADRTP